MARPLTFLLLKRSGFLCAVLIAATALGVHGQAKESIPSGSGLIEFVVGEVEVLRAGSNTPDAATAGRPHGLLNPGDELRTGPRGRAGLYVASQKATIVLDANSRLIMPAESKEKSFFELLKGRLFNFHRGPSGEQRFRSPTVSAIVRGTDFQMTVGDDGITAISMLSGAVTLQNAFGSLELGDSEEGIAKSGSAPQKSNFLVTTKTIQWCLYYPAVLDVTEVPFEFDEKASLEESIRAYITGDFRKAEKLLPVNWDMESPSLKLYGAAVLLGAGSVEKAEQVLAELFKKAEASKDSRNLRLGRALIEMIGAVTGAKPENAEALKAGWLEGAKAPLATEAMARSYRLQAQGDLDGALLYAKTAITNNGGFGHGWLRVAELEFGFRRIKAAETALEHAYQSGTSNAQALALQGFLFAAENRIREAEGKFGEAIHSDPKLANGWLGRGLSRYRAGRVTEAIEDLQMAASVEPQRALLRSCLAKAWSDLGSDEKAEEELEIAGKLDPADPTGWMYSGLVHYRENRINDAVRDLQRAKDLNDNRSIFRSRLTLDEDRAVKSANLAAIYREAGLADASVREATRAVEQDFGNYSAHLFLASSYDSLRDTRQVHLRYETAWYSELLLANLLAPVGAGVLSQNVSQQEYSRLLEKDGVGVSSTTEYLSRGDWSQGGSVFGTYRKTSLSFDSYYASLNGERPNTDLEHRAYVGKLKHQVSPQVTFFAQVIGYENESGDTRQYYEPAFASRTLRFTEKQDPNIYVGLHHEWSPESHTLLLGAFLRDRVGIREPNAAALAVNSSNAGVLGGFDQSYHSQFSAFSVEGEQIWRPSSHTIVSGGRIQRGEVEAQARAFRDPMLLPPPNFFGTADPTMSFDAQSISADLERYTAYGYDIWSILEDVELAFGISYDYVVVPRNADLPPITSAESTSSRFSPKAGFRWHITKELELRAAYSRTVGGTYYESSLRLEPTTVAGFNQAFRSAIPESITGSVPGSDLETVGVGLEWKPKGGTFVGLAAEQLYSKADRLQGAYLFLPPATAVQYRQRLSFWERSVSVDASQLIGDEWLLGLRYRVADAELHSILPELLSKGNENGFHSEEELEAVLHRLELNGVWNHPLGFFATMQGVFHAQHNIGYSEPLPGDSFWQWNSSVGCRFWQRRAEIQVGVLNITGQDYRLNPLNLHADLPRDRTFVARVNLVF